MLFPVPYDRRTATADVRDTGGGPGRSGNPPVSCSRDQQPPAVGAVAVHVRRLSNGSCVAGSEEGDLLSITNNLSWSCVLLSLAAVYLRKRADQ